MDPSIAKSLAEKNQISIDYIVREEYELLLLKELFESEFGAQIVFKGGTALRLAYGSPRYSEDLDFTGIGEFDPRKFSDFLGRIEKRYPAIVGMDSRSKHYTHFAVAKIKEQFLPRAFQIKIEISKRKGRLTKGKDFTERVITGQAAPLTVLANVASLELILREKEDAMKNRTAARDVFDYWFIYQLLGREVKIDLKGYDKHLAKGELHRLLPAPIGRWWTHGSYKTQRRRTNLKIDGLCQALLYRV